MTTNKLEKMKEKAVKEATDKFDAAKAILEILAKFDDDTVSEILELVQED